MVKCLMKQDLHICFCHDDGYVKYASVLMNSIVLNAEKLASQKKEKYRFIFHLICDRISQESIENISIIESQLTTHFECKILFHEFDDSVFRKYHSWNTDGKVSYATYLRLILPEVLDHDIDKCVYLDCDMLCYGDLTELFELDLGESIIAASPDERALMMSLEIKERQSNRKFQHIYQPNECYFNAGTLVINLRKWRNEGITDKCFEYLDKYNISWPDQDVMNMILCGKVKFIPISWNYNPEIKAVFLRKISLLDKKSEELKQYITQVISDQINVNIYHYFGTPKPWWKIPYHLSKNRFKFIEAGYLSSYLNMAFLTPVYGKYFINKLGYVHINNHIGDNSILLNDLALRFNKFKKKYKILELILFTVCGLQLITIVAIICMFVVL